MADLGSPSPSIKSDLSTFERQVSLKSILESYQASHSADDTLFFLQIVFKYLPSDGQRNLIEDLSGCQDDNAIRQHAESLDAGLLRPILSIGGKTPAITPSPRTPRLDDSIENLNSFDGQTVTQIDQQQLRRNCLARDGYQCVLTKCWDVGTTPYPPDDLYTRCKQFISFRPSSGGLEPTTSKIECPGYGPTFSDTFQAYAPVLTQY